jgi:transporter family-2 protein
VFFLTFSAKIVALVIAACAGMIMAVQGSLNTALSKVTGLLGATLAIYVTGLVPVAILFFVFFPLGGGFSTFLRAPWYTYLGGILGVLIFYGVMRSIPKVGVAPATTAIILGQVLTACFIDHFGLFGMERSSLTWQKLAGTALMAAGAWLLLKKNV